MLPFTAKNLIYNSLNILNACIFQITTSHLEFVFAMLFPFSVALYLWFDSCNYFNISICYELSTSNDNCKIISFSLLFLFRKTLKYTELVNIQSLSIRHQEVLIKLYNFFCQNLISLLKLKIKKNCILSSFILPKLLKCNAYGSS